MTTVGTKLAKCTLSLVRIVDVGWDKSGIETAESLIPFYETGSHEIGKDFSYIRKSCQQLSEQILFLISSY